MTSRANPFDAVRRPGAEAERRRRIDELLQAALEVDDPAERRGLLDRLCPAELRCDVDRLLDACGRAEPMPSVAKLRIEALYALGQGELRDEPAEAAPTTGTRQPRSPWQAPE